MSMDTFLEVPISLVSQAESNHILRLLTNGVGMTVEIEYENGLYKTNGEALAYIDLVERLELMATTQKRYVIILRTRAEDVLAQSGIVETVQRICLPSLRDGEESLGLHLAVVVC